MQPGATPLTRQKPNTKEAIMNPTRTIRRLAYTLTGLAAALAAAVAAAPAASAASRVHPAPVPPAELIRFGPAAYTFNGATAGMTNGQIALIVVAAAIVPAVWGLAVLVGRARAARAHRAATAA
jgi:hypothetical protein